MIVYILAALAVILLLLYLKRSLSEDVQMLEKIPGPKGVPLLGNALQVDLPNIHHQLLAWAEHYGDVVKLNLLGEYVVILNSYDAVYEALVKKSDDFAGRAADAFRVQYLFGGSDIIFRDFTPEFKHVKKVVYKGLRFYGDEMANIIKIAEEEVEHCMTTFDDKEGQPFDPDGAIYMMIINIISHVIESKRLDGSDTRFKDMAHMQDLFGAACSAGTGVEIDMFPWLRYVGNKTFNQMKEATELRDKYMNAIIDERLKSFDADNKKDMMDVLLEQHKISGDVYTRQCLINILGNLFGAAITTTHSTIITLLILLMKHPEIQKKLQDEVDDIVGDSRCPNLADKTSMPYLQATIWETFRYLSQVPIAVPHKTTTKTSVAGYQIPKGVQVWPNLFAMHHNAELFPDPWTFRPDRWLESDGQLVALEERNKIMPFGAGRRVCAGEQLARSRLFLFCSNLVHKFTILPPVGEQPPSPDPRDFKLGIVLEPKPIKIRATLRR